MIHATHMTNAETIAMAKSGAVAGLCPITEANLGDAMVQISEAQRYMAETQFKTAMAWARLDALLGKTVYVQEPVVAGTGKQ